MAPFRISIAGLIGLLLVAALGIIGLKEDTEVWASATFTVTALMLTDRLLRELHRRIHPAPQYIPNPQ